jgi:hypothetical protein
MEELVPRKSRIDPEPDIQEEKRVTNPVAKASGKKKKTALSKFAENFIQEDIGNVKSYIITDVLIPTIKKAISDVVSNGVDMILYGADGRRDRGTSTISRITMVPYNNMFGAKKQQRQVDRQSNVYDYGEVIVDSKTDAENVLTAMDEIVDKYHMASVADLYDLVGEVGNTTDHRYGWTDFSKARAERMRDGRYIIKTPRAELLQTN